MTEIVLLVVDFIFLIALAQSAGQFYISTRLTFLRLSCNENIILLRMLLLLWGQFYPADGNRVQSTEFLFSVRQWWEFWLWRVRFWIRNRCVNVRSCQRFVENATFSEIATCLYKNTKKDSLTLFYWPVGTIFFYLFSIFWLQNKKSSSKLGNDFDLSWRGGKYVKCINWN